MEFRMLDETVAIDGLGVMLFTMAEDAPALYDGCILRDIRGKLHTVTDVGTQETLVTLFIAGGDANYFERLFRDIRIDATLFTLLEEGDA